MVRRSIAGARRRRMLIASALCLFALRALIPIGFMLSVGASGAAVTLCQDYAPLLSGAAAQHAHHHAYGAAGAASNDLQLSGSEAHGLCPLAAARPPGGHCSELPALSVPPPQGDSRGAAAAPDVPPVRFFLSFSPPPPPPPL